MTVIVSATAQRDLRSVWTYTLDRFGRGPANRYIAFLRQGTDGLETEWFRGKIAPNGPDVRYLTARKGRGHGHVIVYRVIGKTVEVLRYFHTAQDWQGNIERGEI